MQQEKMKTSAFGFLLILGVAGIYADAGQRWKLAETAGVEARTKLVHEIFEKYDKAIYPENATVQLGASLVAVDFDEDHDIMTSNVVGLAAWQDNRLSWNPEEKGVTLLRIPADKIWVPDVALYNAVNPSVTCRPSNVLLYHTGNIISSAHCKLESHCDVTIKSNPQDEQICKLKFGSPSFDGVTLGFDLLQLPTFDSNKVDLDHYASHKYKVTKNKAVKGQTFYDCCVEPYHHIEFTLGFIRKTKKELVCVNKE